MGARLYDVESLVAGLLAEFPDTRNDDNLLYVKVCKTLNPDMKGITFENGLLLQKELGIPNYKSVERTRRKIQHDNPALKANKLVEDGRYEQYKEYKDYALS